MAPMWPSPHCHRPGHWAAPSRSPACSLSNSFSSYTNTIDTGNYATLVADGTLDNWAYVPNSPLASTAQPPTVAVTSNSSPGATGYGIEFSLASAYKGCDTSSPSGGTGVMAGLLAAVKLAHPTWNWWDIKGAFRQTAANWSTGYDHTNYGYGVVDYDSAVALASTSAVYLQPPVMTLSLSGFFYTVNLYPFRQSRRVREVVYAVPRSYSWPRKNEYVLADITASGGTLAYTSNGTDVIPTFTYVTSPAGPAVNLVAFTTDGSGAYSRVEEFSPMAVQIAFACFP